MRTAALLALGGVLAAGAVAAQSDESAASRRNLRQIATAIGSYELLYEGKHPPTLATLLDEGLLDGSQVFTNPAAGTPATARGEVDDKGDYTMAPVPGVADMVVREKRPTSSPGKVLAVFRDGTLKLIELPPAAANASSTAASGSRPPVEVRRAAPTSPPPEPAASGQAAGRGVTVLPSLPPAGPAGPTAALPAPTPAPVPLSTGLRPPLSSVETQLVLLQQLIRLRVWQRRAPADQEAGVMQEWTSGLLARQAGTGIDPTIAQNHNIEMEAFLRVIEQRLASSPQWPTDQPSQVYAARARDGIQRIRQRYAADWARGSISTTAAPEAQEILGWTYGYVHLEGQLDLFSGINERVAYFIQLARSSAAASTPGGTQGFPGSPVGTPTGGGPCQGFAGTWNTNYGQLIIQVVGDRVTGGIASANVTITGQIIGSTLSGIRRAPGYADAPFRFTLASGGGSLSGSLETSPGNPAGNVMWGGSCGAP